MHVDNADRDGAEVTVMIGARRMLHLGVFALGLAVLFEGEGRNLGSGLAMLSFEGRLRSIWEFTIRR